MACNPYYIYKAIKSKYANETNPIWVLNSNEISLTKEKTVKYGSLLYIWHMLTSKIIISNDTLPTYLPYRKSQIVINTWHGGGLFKQTFGLVSSKSDEKYNEIVNQIHNKETSFYISSSQAWSDNIVRRRFKFEGPILDFGMPRNSILVSPDPKIISKVKSYFAIPENENIILYAPTFRGTATEANVNALDKQPLDILQVKKNLSERFGKNFHFIFRGHHTLNVEMEGCINASKYPDMQELLCSADVFISDYSSCLWDFALLGRPTFIYAPDFDKYSCRPGFESDFKEWPFIIAKSNDELTEKIKNFDLNTHCKNLKKYLVDYTSYENEKSAEMAADFIIKLIKK